MQAFVLGSIGRGIADAIMYPVRTLKVRKQNAKDTEEGRKVLKMGTVELMRYVAKTEGVAALYKGIAAEVFRGVLSAALMLAVKEKLEAVVRFVLLSILGKKK
jgi:hypothetical protein